MKCDECLCVNCEDRAGNFQQAPGKGECGYCRDHCQGDPVQQCDFTRQAQLSLIRIPDDIVRDEDC